MSQNQNNAVYGGQAVIEGVMFAGRFVNVTAVRRKSTNEIEFYEVPKKASKWLTRLKRIPFLRGLVAIVEASAKGAQHLNFSAEVFAEEEELQLEEQKDAAKPNEPGMSGDASKDKPKKISKEESKWSLTMILGVAAVGVISFLFGKFVFTLIPPVIEEILFGRFFENQVLHNFLEGVIKLIFLVIYIYAISLTPMIKRLFQYHGAEHKVISAYEAGLELTVPNVQKFSTLHYRCGSSFIIFTILVGIIVYSFVLYDTLWERLLQRIILLPVVIGVSYEVLRFTNSLREIPLLKYLGYPGLWLQKLTTKEPTDDQVEVSIASFKRMLELENQSAKSAEQLFVS